MIQLNLTEELAQLLTFTSKVAIAIRMNSKYCPESLNDPNAPTDVMWLADCLHNFDQLGKAICKNDTAEIIESCDRLISQFFSYTNDIPTAIFANETFYRNQHHFKLIEAIDILYVIKYKAEKLA